MLKKSLIILFIMFCILCVSNICFATNGTEDVKNAVSSATDTAIDGVSNLAHDVRNGVGDVENGIEDALTMNDTNYRTNYDNYTASRTSTTGTGMGTDTSTIWVWIIVALAAIVIVGLVWYYGNQNRVD